MDVEELRTYCLSLPDVTECFPFDDTSLVFKVRGKMFGLIPLEATEPSITLKCEPELAVTLRENYEAITPAWHFNKKYWNTLALNLVPNDDFVRHNVHHAYRQALTTLPQKDRPAYAATIGFFDGVHCGHRFLLDELNRHAQEAQLRSLAITFDEHPRKVLSSDFTPKLLTSGHDKEELLQTLANEVEVLHFDTNMATLTAQEFMQQVLRRQLNVKMLLLGYDHHFGSDHLSDFADYERIGHKAGIEVIKAQQYLLHGQHISSSAIRQLLDEGDVQQAAILLGRNYSITGTVESGYQIGRELGFPTANLRPNYPEQMLPQTGVYAIEATYGENCYRGMLNIGTRPTLAQPHAHQTIEAHLFDFDGNLYGQPLTVHFLRKIRNEIRFNSTAELQAQLEKDRQACQQ